jgi:hypothetical protein
MPTDLGSSRSSRVTASSNRGASGARSDRSSPSAWVFAQRASAPIQCRAHGGRHRPSSRRRPAPPTPCRLDRLRSRPAMWGAPHGRCQAGSGGHAATGSRRAHRRGARRSRSGSAPPARPGARDPAFGSGGSSERAPAAGRQLRDAEHDLPVSAEPGPRLRRRAVYHPNVCLSQKSEADPPGGESCNYA